MKKILLTTSTLLLFILTYAQPPAGNANPGDIYGEKIKAKGAIAIADVVS